MSILSSSFKLFGILGIILGAASAFNLIASLLSLELKPFLELIIGFYIKIFHGLFDFLFFFIDFEIPTWVKDLFSLYLVVVGIFLRMHWSFFNNPYIVAGCNLTFCEFINVSLLWPFWIVISPLEVHLLKAGTHQTLDMQYGQLLMRILEVSVALLFLFIANAGL